MSTAAAVTPPTDYVKDPQFVTPEGKLLARVPHGVTFKEVPTHLDERGSVFEMFDPRWEWHPAPLEFVYSYTIRPGKVKGWAMHKLHEDRYFVMYGEMKVVLYDSRPESPTCGLVSEVVLSEFNRRLMNVPAGVWHADENIGLKDVIVVNFPTIKYDHTSPDKYRLPLDTDQIPYRFGDRLGF